MAGSSNVSVDLTAVAELAEELARFAGGPAFAEAHAANQMLNAHAPFGAASASGVVAEARARYTRNMVFVVGSAHEYAREAAALSVALRQTVVAYGGSDAQAAADVAVAGQVSAGSGGSFVGPVAPRLPDAEQVASAPPPQHVALADARQQPGWCTNWSAYDARALWQMVEPDNVCAGQSQEVAWRRVTDSLAAHVDELNRKRSALAGAWSSPQASEDMLKRLDRLVGDMRRAVEAAAATRAAIGRINTVIAQKRPELQQFADDYAAKANDLMLRSIDSAEDKVNERARVAMADLERQVREIIQPLPEVPRFVASERIRVDRPPVEPNEPVPPRRTPAPLPGVDPVLPPGQEWTPSAHREGLQLSASPTGPGPVVGPAPAVNVPTPAALPGGAPSWLIGGPPASGPVGGPFPGAAAGPGAGRAPFASTPSRAVPGVIGAMPPGSPSGVGGRVAPPGGVPGVIGAAQSGARPGGAGGRGGVVGAHPGAAGMLPGGAGGRGRQGAESVMRGEGDVVWEVAQGARPVIEANLNPERHEPGPGVIGIDR